MLALSLKGEAKEPLRIAIVDTGLATTDPRFTVCGSKDFTEEGIADRVGHGSHVAGIITAMAEGQGICLLICKFYVESQSGSVDMQHTVDCFNWAVRQHAAIINYSGGGSQASATELAALRRARARGIEINVAAGNERSDVDFAQNFFYPGSYRLPGVQMVGSIDASGERAATSNFGHAVTVVAPGEEIFSTLPSGKYGHMSGTSQATAVVTGSLIRQRLGLSAIPYNLSLWKFLKDYWDRRH